MAEHSTKTILLTGACGYLGRGLIKDLSNKKNYRIWAFDLDKKQTESVFGNRVSACFDNEDISSDLIRFDEVDLLVHLGFARPHLSRIHIADSLIFSKNIFTLSRKAGIPSLINISSQSVYGSELEPPWSEKTPVAPDSPYAMAKYASELILESVYTDFKEINHTSLRLGTLAGGAEALAEVDLLSKIVLQALDGKDITVIGGKQQMERLDIRDAISAIIRLIESDPKNWKPVYNISSGIYITLLEIAERVVLISKQYRKSGECKLIVEEKDVQMKFGMDSSAFFRQFNWEPSHDINSTIVSLFEYFNSSN